MSFHSVSFPSRLVAHVISGNVSANARPGQWWGMLLVAVLAYLVSQLADPFTGHNAACVLAAFVVGVTGMQIMGVTCSVRAGCVRGGSDRYANDGSGMPPVCWLRRGGSDRYADDGSGMQHVCWLRRGGSDRYADVFRRH